ncbi:MAG: glycosyltransferase family 39 protein [Marinifilaceae bacterium]
MNRIFSQKEYLVIFILSIVRMAILAIVNINSGLDGDEVMHIDAGNHLAWGYMSFQPLIGLLAYIQNLFQTNSVFVFHIFSHLVSVLIMIFSGLTIIKLGGGWKAVLLTLLCILVAPGFSVSNHIFTPLAFEQLFWLSSFYILICYCKEQKSKYIIYLAVLLGVGYMAKISILILIASMGVSVLLYKRDLLAQRIFWVAVLVFLLIISPNIYWQYQHDFPSYQHITALCSKMLAKLEFADNIKLLFLTTNPFAAIVWLTGLIVAPFVGFTRDIRMAMVTMLCSFLILLVFKGQFHYYFPAILTAICAGSMVLDRYFGARRIAFISFSAVLVISGTFLTLYSTPFLPLNHYIQYVGLEKKEGQKSKQMFFTQESINDNKAPNTDDRIPINFEAYYTHNDWLNLTASVNSIYQRLPESQKNNCLIWTRCYTQAAAINLYGKPYRLPEAFTQHASYYDWIPEFEKGITIIAVANASAPVDSVPIGSFFASSFEKFTWKEAIFCPYARNRNNAYYMIYLGENLKVNSDTLKLNYKNLVFE